MGSCRVREDAPTPRIGADEGDLGEARIADGLDVRVRRSAAEHTLHTYLPYPRKTKEICGSQRVVGFRFTIFSPPTCTAAMQGQPIHRHRCGECGDGLFWSLATITSKGAALNHPSEPRWRALMHDVPPLAPV